MKKILFLSYTNVFGGAESVLCDYLRNNNVNENYIYTTNKNYIIQEYEKYLKKENIYVSNKMNIISIRKHPLIAIKNLFYNLYKINFIVKKNNIDILYGNNTLDIALLILYKKYLNKNIKIVSHIHDIIEENNYKSKFIKKYNQYVNKFIVPSIATKKALLNCSIEEKNIEVVYNGISIDNRKKEENIINYLKDKYGIDKNKTIFCFIGHICRRKRPDLFINIVNQLNKNENKYIGIIIGKIVEDDYYAGIEKNLNSSIIYLGEVERKYVLEEIYSMADVLILTSDKDPLPTVILEAMSKNVLVIARDVDGVKEIIDNKENGVIFPYNSNLLEIIDVIKSVLNMSEQGKLNMINKAKAKINIKFNPLLKQKIINDILNKI